MEKIREWGFPVALIFAWMLAAAYTVSLMIEPSVQRAPEPPAPPAVEALQAPAS